MDSINIGSLFLEGLLSFYSPCVLPLIPLLIGYLSANQEEENHRLKTTLHIFFFVLGICSVFFLMALSTSALSTFLNTHAQAMKWVGGFLLVFFGLVSLGVIRIPFLEKERRFNVKNNKPMNYLQAFIMGFFFSFAWTPCNGPLLASAIIMASQASSRLMGMVYIGAFCLGFISMFILLGLFTEEILSFIKKKRNIVGITQKIGGAIVLVMGCYMLFQAYRETSQITSSTTTVAQETTDQDDAKDIDKYGFSLEDGQGNTISVKDYEGKTIIVNFFGTWCTYCNQLLPTLQEINDTNQDVKVLLVATPNLGSEKDIEYIEKYMADQGYSMTIMYDSTYEVTKTYGISGYPTTFIYQPDGNMFGYVPGYVDKDNMLSFIERAATNEQS